MSALRTTADGTQTLYSSRFQQTYHSLHGALAEADHLYVYLSRVRPVLVERGHASVLEVGFGTGLNLIATLRACSHIAGTLRYVSMEPFPLTPDAIDAVGYAGLLSGAESEWYRSFMGRLATAPEGELVCAETRIEGLHLDLRVWRGAWADLPATLTNFDAVYQDAFSPESCPELWTPEHFAQVRERLRDGVGTLATYSCASAVRRAIAAAGWEVQRVQGPAGGKREVLQAMCNPSGLPMPGGTDGYGIRTRGVISEEGMRRAARRLRQAVASA